MVLRFCLGLAGLVGSFAACANGVSTPRINQPLEIGQRALSGPPVAVASGDFNADGLLDLAVLSAASDERRLHMLPASQSGFDSELSTWFELAAVQSDGPSGAERLLATDLNADGRADLLIADSAGKLWWTAALAGGGFDAAIALDIGGPAGIWTKGEIGHRDGLDEVAIATQTELGPSLVILQGHQSGPQTALTMALPAPAVALAAGRVDDDAVPDLIVATASQVLLASGTQVAKVASWITVSRAVEPVDLALHDRIRGDRGQLEIAVLEGNGVLRWFNQRGDQLEFIAVAADTRSLLAIPRASGAPGTGVIAISNSQPATVFTSPGKTDDLARINGLADMNALQTLRLGPDALIDIIGIDPSGELRAVVSAPLAIFAVNSDDDLGDSYAPDGICDTENNPTLKPPSPPSGICTLRAAIEQANDTPAMDRINFAIGGGGVQTIDTGALEILAPLVIAGSSQPGFAGFPLIVIKRDGGGIAPAFDVSADASVISSLVIRDFAVAEAIALFSNDNIVVGNFLGTDQTGTVDTTNFRGVAASGSGNVIGQPNFTFSNLISGNFDAGVRLGETASDNLVQNNLVGTDITGTVAFGNGVAGPGIRADGTAETFNDNVVAGHNSVGIWLSGNGMLMQGNRVGTFDGLIAQPNTFIGVFVEEVDGATIGGPRGAGAGNLISGNNGIGIDIAGSQNVLVQSNLVGTDVLGKAALGNSSHGIRVRKAGTDQFSSAIGIGGAPAANFGNVIGANGSSPDDGHGVLFIEDSSASFINGNWIGTDRGSTRDLGNTGDGLRIQESSGMQVGGVFLGFPNFIAFNGGAGVSVVDLQDGVAGQNSNGSGLLLNLIWRNAGLGIDLTRGSGSLDGPTANDPGDADHGPNRLQNFPILTGFTLNSSDAEVDGMLDSTPNTSYSIQVYSSESCDDTGFGEAQEFLGSSTVTTDASGIALLDFDVDPGRGAISAMAINLGTADSSELSPCFVPSGGLLGDRVFADRNADGLQDQDEFGVAGVIVRLLSGAGSLLQTTQTDLAGFYAFTGLASGSYRIEVVRPEGYSYSPPNTGDDAVDSDVIGAPLDPTAVTDSFGYTADALDLSRDAGLVPELFADSFEGDEF